MTVRTTMARSASTSSLRMRASIHAKPWQAIDVFDLAQSIGVEVRFANIASMEGMYLRQELPVILIASERPAGRQRFTCAHELGHHVFGDGSRVDELFETGTERRQRGDEELRADMFAGLLLMPKTAVQHGFAVRDLKLSTVTAMDVFRVTCWLGVGYTTLLKHLKYALHIIPEDRFQDLMRYSPKSIRESVLESQESGDMIVADERWDSRPIDLRVGDVLLAPTGASIEGRACAHKAELESGSLFAAVMPGVARVETTSWAAFVRVARRGYEGRSVFRHLEEVDDE
jgi:hypothetical protein